MCLIIALLVLRSILGVLLQGAKSLSNAAILCIDDVDAHHDSSSAFRRSAPYIGALTK